MYDVEYLLQLITFYEELLKKLKPLLQTLEEYEKRKEGLDD